MLIKNSGQSLIEVIIVVGLVTIIATSLISISTAGLKTGHRGKLRSEAVILAQDGIEISRKLRDSDWNTFQTTYGSLAGKAWCLDNSAVWTEPTSSCPLTSDSLFSRSITFTWDGTRMKIDSMVSWNEQNQIKDITLTTYFTDWR